MFSTHKRGKVKSTGCCYFCQATIRCSDEANNHLTTCLNIQNFFSCSPESSIINTEEVRTPGYFLKVYDLNRPDVYWMIIAAPATFTLKQLDTFLRYLWCECCNHLSCFEIINPNKTIANQTISFAKTLKDISYEILSSQKKKEKKLLKYTYDYGDSTYLCIDFLQEIAIYPYAQDQIFMIERNHLPEHICGYCQNEKGKYFCQGCNQFFGINCHEFTKLHQKNCQDTTTAVLDVVNSPRCGCCGYQGGHYNEEQFEFFIPFDSTGIDQVQSRTSSLNSTGYCRGMSQDRYGSFSSGTTGSITMSAAALKGIVEGDPNLPSIDENAEEVQQNQQDEQPRTSSSSATGRRKTIWTLFL